MSLVYEKQLPYEQPLIRWCSLMDLIGVISQQDNRIEVHRVGYKHQKVFTKEEAVRPSALFFTEKGRQCVVGYEDGRLSILKSDTA